MPSPSQWTELGNTFIPPIPVLHDKVHTSFPLSIFVASLSDRNLAPIILNTFTYLINLPEYNQFPTIATVSYSLQMPFSPHTGTLLLVSSYH